MPAVLFALSDDKKFFTFILCYAMIYLVNGTYADPVYAGSLVEGRVLQVSEPLRVCENDIGSPEKSCPIVGPAALVPRNKYGRCEKPDLDREADELASGETCLPHRSCSLLFCSIAECYRVLFSDARYPLGASPRKG